MLLCSLFSGKFWSQPDHSQWVCGDLGQGKFKPFWGFNPSHMRCMRPNIVDHSKVNPHPTTYPGYISLVDQGMPYIKPGSKLAIAEDVFQVCYDDHWVLRFDVNESHGLVWNMVSSGEWGYWGGWICQMLLSSLGDRAPCWEGLCSKGKAARCLCRSSILLKQSWPWNQQQVQMPANDWEWYCLNQVHSR